MAAQRGVVSPSLFCMIAMLAFGAVAQAKVVGSPLDTKNTADLTFSADSLPQRAASEDSVVARKASTSDVDELHKAAMAGLHEAVNTMEDVLHAQLFEEFTRKFNKKYTKKSQALLRFSIFKQNRKNIDKYNALEQASAVYDFTEFADLTPQEWKQTYHPFNMKPLRRHNEINNIAELGVSVDAVPDAFDWRQNGAVTEVKNQGQCGSCWAFSATGNVEGQWFKAKGELVSVSEQELVDCDKVDHGCEGGYPLEAYKIIMELGGLEKEKDYPYEGRGETCNIDKSKLVVYVNGSLTLPKNEDQMKTWLYANGPISIGINANPLQFYSHGILHPYKLFCEPSELDHGVLIVGYGTEKGTPFWIVKNSWGAHWGEKGYFRVYRGKNVCGVSEMATSAIVK